MEDNYPIIDMVLDQEATDARGIECYVAFDRDAAIDRITKRLAALDICIIPQSILDKAARPTNL
ncbi:hypothetical protein FWG76_01285 [Candidatus Saccharibacteria bacterium]|nr:hypothetical protein [Candidatus Saccharibacteria bacterium]